MNSMSVVTGARTPLGRAVLARQEPSKIVVAAVRDKCEMVWIKSHYPWFETADLTKKEITLPDTKGPVKIYICDHTDAQSMQSLESVRVLLQNCGLLPVRVITTCPISRNPEKTEIRSPQACHDMKQHMEALRDVCRSRQRTFLSVIYSGHINDWTQKSGQCSFLHTSCSRLARAMIKAGTSDTASIAISGWDARWRLILAGIKQMSRGFTEKTWRRNNASAQPEFNYEVLAQAGSRDL